MLAGLIGLLRGAHLAQLCGRANRSARARPLLLRPALGLDDAHRSVPDFVSLAPAVRRAAMLKADDEAAAPLPFATAWSSTASQSPCIQRVGCTEPERNKACEPFSLKDLPS